MTSKLGFEEYHVPDGLDGRRYRLDAEFHSEYKAQLYANGLRKKYTARGAVRVVEGRRGAAVYVEMEKPS